MNIDPSLIGVANKVMEAIMTNNDEKIASIMDEMDNLGDDFETGFSTSVRTLIAFLLACREHEIAPSDEPGIENIVNKHGAGLDPGALQQVLAMLGLTRMFANSPIARRSLHTRSALDAYFPGLLEDYEEFGNLDLVLRDADTRPVKPPYFRTVANIHRSLNTTPEDKDASNAVGHAMAVLREAVSPECPDADMAVATARHVIEHPQDTRAFLMEMVGGLAHWQVSVAKDENTKLDWGLAFAQGRIQCAQLGLEEVSVECARSAANLLEITVQRLQDGSGTYSLTMERKLEELMEYGTQARHVMIMTAFSSLTEYGLAHSPDCDGDH